MGSGKPHASGDAKRRKSIANSQRRALRAWFYDTTNGPKSQADASVWWKEAYGYHLNSSTVSEILSYKYDFLDVTDASASANANAASDERRRDRPTKWEVLEQELVAWVFSYESVVGEGSVTSSMLRQRGTELWNSLPCYQGMPEPKWSEGWRSRFKARYMLYRQRILEDAAELATSSGASSSYGGYSSDEIFSTESAYGINPSHFGSHYE
ncbi:centromere binding protein B [Colletotrichum higginsianum]|nr:centromere binding protein B [Colletotrichum higginsianum]